MFINKVKLSFLENSGKELSDNFYFNCNFCTKSVQTSFMNYETCSNLSGDKKYCPFCLRHNFHYKSNKNVLMFSFRSVIGYYYHCFYKDNKKKTNLFVSEIQTLTKNHQDVGLENPVFSYDPETYMWFLDFNKIGETSRKSPLEEVLEVFNLIFDSFYVEFYIDTKTSDQLRKKYIDSIILFQEKRERPDGKKILTPTFLGSKIYIPNQYKANEENFYEMLRNFCPDYMFIR